MDDKTSFEWHRLWLRIGWAMMIDKAADDLIKIHRFVCSTETHTGYKQTMLSWLKNTVPLHEGQPREIREYEGVGGNYSLQWAKCKHCNGSMALRLPLLPN